MAEAKQQQPPQTALAASGVWKTVKPFVNGGASGMLATCVIQPIDMVKVKIQLGEGSATTVTKKMLANEGVGSFYKGLSAGLLRQATYTTARLGSFSMARSTWALSDEVMVEHMMLNREPNARSWLFAMYNSLSSDEFTKMLVTLWVILTARRKAIHEDIFQSPISIHGFVSSFLSEIKVLQNPKPSTATNVVSRPQWWLPPPDGHAKINVDAATPRAGGSGAVGAVCRDKDGLFLGASAVVFPNIDDPATLEALANREAQALMEDLYLQHIFVASDCQVIVQAINKGSAAQFGAIIHQMCDYT